MSGRARKKWGQHWLANDELAAALVEEIMPRPGDRFLEIGPGRGRLTRALLSAPVEVLAVEVDPACCAELEPLTDGAGRLRVVEGDILDLDVDMLDLGSGRRWVGNLPYNISSPILRRTVELADQVHDAHYMLAADVAERVLAPAGSSRRGLLSVELQWRFQGEIVRRLGPGAFRPRPRVESAFLRLIPVPPPVVSGSARHRRELTRAAFAHRRKTLSNNLQIAGWSRDEVDEALAAAGLGGKVRAQELGRQALADLVDALPERPR